MDTKKDADACSVGKVETINKNLQTLREIRFFISRFFTIEIENPTEDDVMQGERLAELTILLMSNMLQRGMKERQEAVFAALFYVKDMGGGIGKLNYAFETQGGKMFEQLGLGVMGQKLEIAIGEWCEKVWGGKLTTEAADTIQAWSGAINKK